MLRCLPGVVRGIILNEPALASSKVVCIPLHGVIAAGYANDSVELDGDYVIHDSARTPKHNDIVAALIDGETALKRLMVQGTQRWLKAENPRFPNLIAANSLQVQGVMRALIRGHEARRESMDE